MNIFENEVLEDLFPSVNVSRITLESSNDSRDKLISNVQFVLTETVENDDVSLWIESNNSLKYLSILVIQSIDEELTNKILQNDKLQQIAQKVRQTSQIEELVFSDTIKDILEETNLSNFSAKLVSFKDVFTNNELAKKSIEIALQDDGSKNLYLFKDITFGSDLNFTESPQHLNYIFILYYNLGSFLSDPTIFQYGTASPNSNSIILLPYLVSNENVISDGLVIEKSDIFLTERDEIWTGPVHELQQANERTGQTETVYRTGKTETINSVNLRKIQVDNNKIIDYRQLKNLMQVFPVHELIPEYLIQDNILKQQESVILQENESFISDNFISVDSGGYVANTFFIDFKKLFIKKSPYGKLLSNSQSAIDKNLINYLYNKATIESMILKVRRIDLDDSLSGIKNDFQIIPNLNSTDVINIANKNISFNLETDSTQIKCFSITDTIPKINGIYEYYLEIDYKDNVVETVKSKIESLKQEQDLLKKYYDIAILPDSFNEYLNRFNINFPNILLENLNINLQNSFINLIVVLKEMFNMTQADLFFWSIGISKYLSPVDGTPESIYEIIKLYESTINTLSRIISSVPTVDNSINEKGNGFEEQQSVSSVSQIINLTKLFKTTINLNNSYKLEYLNHRKNSNISNYFSSDFSYELTKTDLISKKLNLSSEFVIQPQEQNQKEQSFNKLYDILSNNGNLKITRIPAIEMSDSIRTDDFITEFRPPAFGFNQIIGLQEPYTLTADDKVRLNQSLSALLNPTLDLNNQNISISFNDFYDSNLFWKITPNDAVILSIPANFGGLGTGLIQLVKNLFKETTIPLSKIKALPNQVKSLINLKKNIDSDARISAPEDGKIRLKYEMLKNVKFLKGFKYNNEDATYFMQEPIWDVLKNLQQLEQQNGMVFCYLQDYNDYSDEQTIYKFNLSLKEIAVNEYFFLNRNINNFGKIINGATQITFDSYESRCNKEISDFFAQNTNVEIVIDGVILNQGDSTDQNKYSFLSPIGVYFDQKYKKLEAESPLSIREQIPTINIPVDNIPTIGPEIVIPTIQQPINPEIITGIIPTRNNINNIRNIRDIITDGSVSTSATLVGQQPSIVGRPSINRTIYSRNDIRDLNRTPSIASRSLPDSSVGEAINSTQRFRT